MVTEQDLLEQGKAIKELMSLAETPEQVKFLQSWNRVTDTIDMSRLQETIQALRSEVNKLKIERKGIEETYIKIIKVISNSRDNYYDQ